MRTSSTTASTSESAAPSAASTSTRTVCPANASRLIVAAFQAALRLAGAPLLAEHLAAVHQHAQVVGGRGALVVGEGVAEAERPAARAGGERDGRRFGAGNATVEIVGAGRGAGCGARHKCCHAAEPIAALLDTRLGARLRPVLPSRRHPPWPCRCGPGRASSRGRSRSRRRADRSARRAPRHDMGNRPVRGSTASRHRYASSRARSRHLADRSRRLASRLLGTSRWSGRRCVGRRRANRPRRRRGCTGRSSAAPCSRCERRCPCPAHGRPSAHRRSSSAAGQHGYSRTATSPAR